MLLGQFRNVILNIKRTGESGIVTGKIWVDNLLLNRDIVLVVNFQESHS